MACAINIRCDNESAEGIRSLWALCAPLETSASMPALGYPPHLTLAVYDQLAPADLFEVFDSTFGSVRRVMVRFESLGFFRTPESVILWAAPMLPDVIRAAHEKIHAEIDVARCRRNYRPEHWVPHCSLATSVDPERTEEALALARSPIEPVEVTFDIADCASFMPVKVLREMRLG